MPKLACTASCKYQNNKKCTKTKISINTHSKCSCYEPDFIYYFYYYLNHINNSNFLTYPDLKLHPEFRYSIYYMMRCLPICYRQDDIRGIILLYNEKTKEPLTSEAIYDLIANHLSEEETYKCAKEFQENGLPKLTKVVENTVSKPYGWLSPSGDFYPADFGDHESKAQEICEKLGINDDIDLESRNTLTKLGWCLLHDPSGLNGYIVSYTKNLTKKQKDFLYEYFSDMGMKSRAESFIND